MKSPITSITIKKREKPAEPSTVEVKKSRHSKSGVRRNHPLQNDEHSSEDLSKMNLGQLCSLRDDAQDKIVRLRGQIDHHRADLKEKKIRKVNSKWLANTRYAMRKKGILISRLTPLISNLNKEKRKQEGLTFERSFMQQAFKLLDRETVDKLMAAAKESLAKDEPLELD